MLERPIIIPIDLGPYRRKRWRYVVTDYRHRTKEYPTPKEAREAWEKGERIPVFDPELCRIEVEKIKKSLRRPCGFSWSVSAPRREG